jgi:general secretion pathway protein I
MSTPPRQSGFTLIEVLVAFAVFALSIGAIYEVFADASRQSARTSVRNRNLLTAQSMLSAQRVRPAPWDAHRMGQTEDGESWEITVVPVEAGTDENSRWKAYEIAVRVGPREEGSGAVVLRSIELAASVP